MIRALENEWLKLKHSKLIIFSIFGAILSPLILYFLAVILNSDLNFEPVNFVEFMAMMLRFLVKIVAILLYNLIAAELMTREFRYDTLKSQLTIPISRTGILLFKIVIISIWLIALTLLSFFLGVIVSLLLNLDGLSLEMFFHLMFIYFKAAFLILPHAYFTLMLVLIFRSNYVPMFINIIILVINMVISQTNLYALFPFSAASRIIFLASPGNEVTIPLNSSYMVLFGLMVVSVYVGYKKINSMEI